MKIIYITLALALLSSINSEFNTCHPACGGNSPTDCADYAEAESSAEKCYSCASGHRGGSGRVNGAGALCMIGDCPDACAACQEKENPNLCYLCSYGFYDPIGNSAIATPCVPCHESCLSCEGPTENDCKICAVGYFDSLNNPYSKGSCSKCDSKFSACSVTAKGGKNGCCAQGYSKKNAFSFECTPDAVCTYE